MSAICLRCHRPLKNPATNGMGPVCAKAVQPVAEVERDLFGYDIEAAALAAQARLAEWTEARIAAERAELRRSFIRLRAVLGVRL
ncbi:MAG TPA: hypothetical protein DDX06_13705 [Curvibacter sp.]|nr:hypothetical protein [Curvibacter sp.]